jgi:hypothetical protein
MEDPEPRQRMSPGRVVAIIFASLLNIALVVAIAIVAFNPQRLVDQVAFWQFEPSDEVARYAEQSTMTDEGRFLFYASHPSIERDEAFDAICATHVEDVGVLGCYVHREKRIYLYDVDDDRLAGIEEVVAAHEMLHAAWDRMSPQEQRRLERLLEAEVAARADDAELARTLEFYAAAEPGERANELHSILGTEYGDLGEELEAHYATYFADRVALVTLHERSNAVFVQQRAAIDALVAQLEALSAAIDADYAVYNTGYDQLNAGILDFNARAEAGDFDSLAGFNAERSALMARQAELDALYASIDTRVAEYDALVAQLDDLNAQVDELNQSINVTPRPESGIEP